MGRRDARLAALGLSILFCITGCRVTDPSQAEESSGVELAAVSAANLPVYRYGGTLRILVDEDAESLDPHLDAGPLASPVLQNLYDNLVELDEEGEIVGALAQSWNLTDDISYVFHLRKEVVFHDGEPLTSADVTASLHRMADESLKPALLGPMQNLRSVEAIDDHTVRVTLKKPDAGFLKTLTDPAAAIVSAKDLSNGFDFSKEENGTGPFRLVGRDEHGGYIMTKNASYWRSGLPYLAEIVCTPLPDSAERAELMVSRRADVDVNVDESAYERYQDEEELSIWWGTGPSAALRVNVCRPPLDDPLVRRAISYLIDREEIADSLWNGLGKPVTSGVAMNQNSFCYFPELEGSFPSKPSWDKASELLKEAGYGSPDELPPIELCAKASDDAAARKILRSLEAFGLTVDWKEFDDEAFYQIREEGRYGLLQDRLTYELPDDLERLFGSNGGTGYALTVGYRNAELDRLVEEGKRTADPEKRKALIRSAYLLLSSEQPILYEASEPSAVACGANLRGYNRILDAPDDYAFGRAEYLWFEHP